MGTQYFAFRAVVQSNSKRLETFFLLAPDAFVREQELDFAITRLLADGGISPDIFVCVYFEPDEVHALKMLAQPALKVRLESTKRCKAILAIRISSDGSFKNVQSVLGAPFESLGISPEALFESYRHGGMSLLAQRDGVVVNAAPGSYFLKPSGNRQTYFIRAALLCRTSLEATYVASLLLSALSVAKRGYGDRSPNLILVDTVGIAFMAYALVDVGVRVGFFDSRPEIRSFGSYGGVDRISPGIAQLPFFLISASTSGQLAKQIQDNPSRPNIANAITTILGAFDGEFPSLVYRLTSAELPIEAQGKEFFDTLSEIRVHGEDFLFSPGAPRAVDLKRPHLPREFGKQFGLIQGKSLVKYFKKTRQGKPEKPFLIFDKGLVEDDGFKAWLFDQAKLRFPIAVRRIIYQDDTASKLMGEILISQLSELWKGKSPVLTSIGELEDLDPNISEPIVVVAAVAGSGMELMRICRELRRYQPEGGRYFLIGALVARSYRQLLQVRSNLQQSKKPNHYAIAAWCEFCPARTPLEQMHARELKMWTEVLAASDEVELADEVSSFAKSRKLQLEDIGIPRSEIVQANPFISTDLTHEIWNIGKSFALWDHKFTENNCPVDVLFTVACWLQNARESGELKLVDRLHDGGFQHVVIAPDCFLRFTDPVIQASIFRSGHDSEFNYVTSDELSARATEIIVKFIELDEGAKCEFLFALSEGRMRLKKNHLQQVLQSAESGPSAIVKLLANRARARYL